MTDSLAELQRLATEATSFRWTRVILAPSDLLRLVRIAQAARDLMLYADECALVLRATHPGKSTSLDARVAALREALGEKP